MEAALGVVKPVLYNSNVKVDHLTRHAVRHTLHCLFGCGVGEIVGMFLASGFGWHRVGRLPLAVGLAFVCGYSLTYRGVRKQTKGPWEAIKITAATDTISITTMELVDNTLELLIPNALLVTATQPRFWWGLALSLSVAFLITVPVNRYMMSRGAQVYH